MTLRLAIDDQTNQDQAPVHAAAEAGGDELYLRSLMRLSTLFPNQCTTYEENREIKAGRLLEGWDENPDGLQQKDLVAPWTHKSGLIYDGYKSSIYIDADHGFICRYGVTPANIHDSQMLPLLLDPENEHDYVFADSTYSG
jgi:transposase, IS5 family